jgi:hypothetical protein
VVCRQVEYLGVFGMTTRGHSNAQVEAPCPQVNIEGNCIVGEAPPLHTRGFTIQHQLQSAHDVQRLFYEAGEYEAFSSVHVCHHHFLMPTLKNSSNCMLLGSAFHQTLHDVGQSQVPVPTVHVTELVQVEAFNSILPPAQTWSTARLDARGHHWHYKCAYVVQVSGAL